MNSQFQLKNTYAIVGGSNFSGSWRVYQSLQDAQRFARILADFGLPKDRITTLYGNQYTRVNILSNLKTLANKLKSGDTAIIYFAGHGTQVRDLDNEEVDGRDEALQTDDRRLVTDDELSAPFTRLGNNQPKNSDFRVKIITIADTCHSPSLDMWRFEGTPVDVISIKAALDNQSALQSGNGSYMSSYLFPILQDPRITVVNLQKQLESNMREGFAGSMQLSKVEVSRKELLKLPLFH